VFYECDGIFVFGKEGNAKVRILGTMEDGIHT
jgi:hypothetical protein